MSVNYSLTKAGLDIMALGQTGKQIEFTCIVLGDGELAEGQTPSEMTQLVHEVLRLPINFCQAPGNGTVKIGAPFSNADLEVGFLYRELGAKAIHPDSGEEVLYCCGNAGEAAEWIGAYATPKLIEKQIYVNTVVGNAENVTAVIDSELALSREALEQHDADAGAHAAAVGKHNSDEEAHPGIQAAVNALKTEKANLAGAAFTGNVTVPNSTTATGMVRNVRTVTSEPTSFTSGEITLLV